MMTQQSQGTELYLRLTEVSADDRDRVGSKAANEAELLRAGFEVPEAIVITTDAFQRFLQANRIASDGAPEAVRSGTVPEEILNMLQAGVNGLGEHPLAVRSSGVAEDLPGASYAGQYDTRLNVRGKDDLEAALLRCWASAFNPHVVAYRNRNGQSANGMAVLIQKMVPADVAGVAFSANPVSGKRDEIVINAVRGLGERLVSGQASPDEWVVKDGEAHCQRAPESAIDREQARAIAEMARRVEAYFGAPQDIEWALAGDQLSVLQARPITSLPDEEPEMVPIAIEVPPGFWQQDASRFPDPVTPMFTTLGPEIAMIAMQRSIEEFGLLTDGLEIIAIGGYGYQRLKPLGGKEPPPIPMPTPLMWLLVRLMPAMRARMKQAKECVRTDRPGGYIERWYAHWLPEVEKRTGEVRDVDLEKLSDRALVQHLEEILTFFRWSVQIHGLMNNSVGFILYEFVSTCRELLGWDEAQAFELVSGTSYKSTEPGRRLHELAQMAYHHPAVSQLLEQIDDETASRLEEVDQGFADAFAIYQHSYGCRSIRWDVLYPSLEERPGLTLRLIRDQMARGFNPAQIKAELEQDRAEKVAEAKAALAGNAEALAEFERALERAEKAYPLREANQFYTFSTPMALLRYALLEIGSRLAKEGVILERDDVFFLEKDEACSALFEGGDRTELVQRRKGEMAWAKANPGPAYYGDPPPPPSFDFLPAEARLIMGSLIWSFEQMMEYEGSGRTQIAGETITGIAASSGQYTGPCRIVADETEFHKIQPGDVMVCPMTSPVWSVLCPSLGALVTDAGGLLSHPAIIAREYRIPAVVATGNATSILQDGQMVRVDGASGTIEVIA
jgi:phosphohistidine swiveling domain-containing protein